MVNLKISGRFDVLGGGVVNTNLLISEQGENYIRYNNGIQICYGTLTVNNSTTLTLPMPYKDTSYSFVATTEYEGDKGSRLIVVKTCGKTASTVHCVTSTQYGTDTQFRSSNILWMSIGKWK